MPPKESGTVAAKPAKASAPVMPAGAGAALATVLTFSAAMAIVPVGLYFGSYNGLFDGIYRLTVGIPQPDQRAVVSAILAVLGVNLVVGCFIFVAFREVTDDKPKTKRE
ncbi:hypothetical protein HYH03_011102 [Edaphochlamys debaryana]|uniref:Uncharacterized protein n=1 Tax=Edaphochlamys debaryana TaxID=47281 RepID=A0A835XUI0_9CHLO|nr:hypothetical protein HYH03_011102 [Edaphochlamys debaryana]|eukprot:KAG2490473.1 hypothetical protein HYH03_011102 [Edaphochlamys debaryana]